MGTKQVDVCDIYGTLQPRGLRTIHVRVWEDPGPISACKEEYEWLNVTIQVGNRGFVRAISRIEDACNPLKKPQPKQEAAT